MNFDIKMKSTRIDRTHYYSHKKRNIVLKILLLGMILIVFEKPLGCSNDVGVFPPQGDIDTEKIENEEFADVEDDNEDYEENIRERPENPEDAQYTKTLWRDEVTTGQTFTWGFFPRDYSPYFPKYSNYFPIVWEDQGKKILSVDHGRYRSIDPYHFVVYSLSERKSEILASAYLPTPEDPGWQWSTDATWIEGMVLWENKLLFTFRKNGLYWNNIDYVITGLVSFDLFSHEVRYLYYSMKLWSEVDLLGMVQKYDENTLLIRRETGLFVFDLNDETMNPVRSYCDEDHPYLQTCNDFANDKDNNLKSAIKGPLKGYEGFALFSGRLASLALQNSGDIVMNSLIPSIATDCKSWQEHKECNESWLSFSQDCCVDSRKIEIYKEKPYVLSATQAILYEINLQDNGYKKKVGRSQAVYQYALSPDGTQASEAILGTPQDWLITPDGDLMWFSPSDYSVRGIAGPLEEWAEKKKNTEK